MLHLKITFAYWSVYTLVPVPLGSTFFPRGKLFGETCHILDPIIKGKITIYYASNVEMVAVWFISCFSCTRFSVVCLREVILLCVTSENLGSCVESELPTLFRRNGRLLRIMNERKCCSIKFIFTNWRQFVSFRTSFVRALFPVA